MPKDLSVNKKAIATIESENWKSECKFCLHKDMDSSKNSG